MERAVVVPTHLTGFSNRILREQLAPLLGQQPADLTLGKMTYHLLRLRLHGMIERIPNSYLNRLTDLGLRSEWFFTRTYARILRPGLATSSPTPPQTPTSVAASINSTTK